MLTSLSTYGYIILFLYSIGGGMVAIIAAGVLSYIGKMDITLSIVIATLANTLGDTMLFYLSRYNKAAFMPYLRKHRRKLAYSHILMKKHGDKLIFFKKYIYGLKTLIPVAIGLTGYDFKKFTIINFIASAAWAVVLGLGSFYAGEMFVKASEFIGENSYVMPIFMLFLLGSIYFILHKATKKSKFKENK